MRNKTLTRRDFLISSALTTGALFAPGLCGTSMAHAALSGAENDRADIFYNNPQIAIIIDDVGFNMERVRPFMQLDVPITFSVLPHLPHSRLLAEKIHAQGHEIMLHQPMEPHNMFINPGPGALYLSHTSKDMVGIIQKNIESFPYAVGFNNHMGSRFTESRPKMTDTLKIFKDQNFFFVDSITSQNSIGFDTAKNMQMTASFRNEFIDNSLEKQYMRAQVQKLKKHALRFGKAIGIGHPKPATTASLPKFINELKSEGFSFVYASQIVQA